MKTSRRRKKVPKQLREQIFPLTPAEYEKLVESIINLVSGQTNFDRHGCGLTNRIQGWSSCRHQIDVSFIEKRTKLLLLVECKQWRRKISLADVLAFHSRIRDIGRKKNQKPLGMMVTTKGYQAGAEKYTAKYGIKTNLAKDNAEFSLVFSKIGNVINLLIGERQI